MAVKNHSLSKDPRFLSASKTRNGFNALVADSRGLSTVEYVIILVLVAAVCVATWAAFGGKLKEWLGIGEGAIAHEIDGADFDAPNGNGAPASGGGGATPGGGGKEVTPPPKVKRKIDEP
jgi:Flp pilus assembly pilin Flp